MFLWFYAERTRMEMSAREQKSLVTEIDILYGEDVPWYGFQGLDPPTTEEQVGKIEKVTLLYRKGVQRTSAFRHPLQRGLIRYQPFRARRPCISRTTADSRSCKSRTCTSPSAAVLAATQSSRHATAQTT
jgi:hypothetical protein